jgi:hypothetical protein
LRLILNNAVLPRIHLVFAWKQTRGSVVG